MSTTDLLYSDTEEQLRASVRKLLADRCAPETVAAAYDSPADFSALWREFGTELGLCGLLVPESLGGAGASTREAAVVAEEVGRAVAPVPFLTSAVLATVALLRAGEREVLAALAAGESTAALAVPLAGSRGAEPGVRVESGRLSGSVRTVAGADAADVLVVPAIGQGGIELHTVSHAADGVDVEAVTSLDMSRPVADVTLSGVESNRVDTADAAEALSEARLAGMVVLAAEQVGVASWCFETTLEYVKQRRQFGRTIGSYQAIKHRMADLWLELNQAGATSRYAADAHARGADTAVAAELAQAYCGPVAVHAAEECIQLHGGIGMTWEHPAHLYLKRAKADELALGTAYQHRRGLAELVELPPN